MYKFIEHCLSWDGYLEKATNDKKYYDDKTANAGSNNYNRFSYIFDKTYGTGKDGYPWCACFICANMIEAYGVEKATDLMCGGMSAGCTQIWDAFSRAGRTTRKAPRVGDLIIFGDCDHIGAVYAVDDNNVYTIEGNTSSAPGMVSNGGCARKKQYSLDYSKIKGYCRPDYTLVEDEEEEMTQEKFNEMFMAALNNTADTGDEHSDWATDAINFCKEKGIFNGDGDGNYAWRLPITREATAQVLYNVLNEK